MDGAKIVSIRGGKITSSADGPVEDVISILEQALEDARAGLVRSIAIAYTLEDGDPQPLLKTAWHNEPRYFPHIWLAVSRLFKRLEDSLD